MYLQDSKTFAKLHAYYNDLVQDSYPYTVSDETKAEIKEGN